ncbi:hypothetical protein ACLUWO_04840 [Pseudoscardovia radai]|uniref:hypothetical protein n=1 Tax=Pseudoscardovia radai TaxID=987066 RepID=UPI003992528A
MRNMMRAVSAMLVVFLSLVSMAACGESSSGASGGSKSGSSAVTFTQAIENHKLWFLVEPSVQEDDSVINPTLNKDDEIDSFLVRIGGTKGQYKWTVYLNGSTNKSTHLTFQDINGKTDDEIISLLDRNVWELGDGESSKTTVTTSTYVTTDPTGSNAESEFIASGLSKDSDGYYCYTPQGMGIIKDNYCYPKGGDNIADEARGGMPLTHTSQIYDMYFQGLESSANTTYGEEEYDTKFLITRVDADDPGIVMDSPKDGAVTVVG